MNKKRHFRRFFVCPDRGFHLLCLYPPKLPILCLPKKAQDTELYSISRLPRYSSGQEPANPTYPNHNLLTFLFHSDPKTTLPPPSPISILAVPASLYLLYFSILLAYAAAFVPPQHTSLLLLRGRPCIPPSRKFLGFFLFNRPRCAPLFPFLSVLPGFVFPRRESFFASFFSKKEGTPL